MFSLLLTTLNNMEHKGFINASFLFIITLCVYCMMVDSVKASIHRSSNRRRSIQEEAGIGEVDICADIIERKWNVSKQEKSPCPNLVVWVPKTVGFPEFVKLNRHDQVEDGFSIAIFCYVLQLLPFNVRPIFKAFVNEKGEMNGTFDQLVSHIKGQTCQAVVGDVAIRFNRAQSVYFTPPYLNSGVYMLVLATPEWNQTFWTFLRPFTKRLWITIVCACISTGVTLAILEYRSGNPKFKNPFYKLLIMVFWFPISTFFFNEGKILNKYTKVVLVMWLCMIFIILQIFTATLSSWLTLDQLRPRLPSSFENVGYPRGSYVKDLMMKHHNRSSKNLVPLDSYKEYESALSNGSVNAVVDDLHYIDQFLSKHGDGFTKFGPIDENSGIAFAFPFGSPLFHTVSKKIIYVTEDELMMELKRNYFGISDTTSQPNTGAFPQSLDVQGFIGLFILMGIVNIGAIISSRRIPFEEDLNKNTMDGQV